MRVAVDTFRPIDSGEGVARATGGVAHGKEGGEVVFFGVAGGFPGFQAGQAEFFP